ncbi:MAG: helix-turn-helix domain-containing protein [Micropepsaceae bacterium]
MSTNNMTPKQARRLRDYDRGMLRSAFVSLFWSVVSERRRRGDFTLQALAKKIGRDKSAMSRWFSGTPNWTLDTIADLAGALDLELRVEARERTTGMVFGARGAERHAPTTTFVSTTTVASVTERPKTIAASWAA